MRGDRGVGGRGRGDAPQERRDWNTGSLLPGQIPPAWPIGESVLALGWPALASPGRDVCLHFSTTNLITLVLFSLFPDFPLMPEMNVFVYFKSKRGTCHTH